MQNFRCLQQLFIVSFFCVVLAKSADAQRLVFGSCVGEANGQIWQSIQTKKPDLLLFLGDVVYLPTDILGDSEKITNYLKSIYNADTDAGKTIEQFKTFAIWDDHDFGPDNSGSEFLGASATRESYSKFWRQNPRPVSELAPALTFKHTTSKYTLLVLDGRTFRTKPKQQESIMYGNTQLQWLSQELQKVPSDKLIVIASGTTFLMESNGDESFANYALEQGKFLNILQKLKRPVVLLSGDRHFGQILQYPDSQIYEIVSSPITAAVAEAHKQFVSKYGKKIVAENNFGMLEFSSNKKKCQVQASLHDTLGRKKSRICVVSKAG